MTEITVKMGKKADESVDKSKAVQGKKPEPSGEAEGQYAYIQSGVACWSCWALNTVWTDTDYQVPFYCWNDGALNYY